jgi:hypothetical protein
MKKANGQQLSLFDITLEHNTQNIVTESPTVSEPMKTERPIVSGNNFCPYPIPKVDEIIKMIDRSAYKVNRSQLISDVFECGALAISNMVDFTKYDEREKRYLDIMNGYSPDERKLLVDIFSKIFALSSSVVYDNGKFGDYLGELFMRCNQGNKFAGQFFTPYHISYLMARCAITDDSIKQNEIMTICDPCCGGGGMAMAALDVLKNDYKVNYAMDCFIECADIDIRCVHMTYLQLALAGVPAIVKHQNTLTQELYSVWKTPAYIFQYHRFYKYGV